MKTKLIRIAEFARKNPKMKFTSLAQLLSADALKQCHYELAGNKATGIDGLTKAEYAENLNENITKLVERLKRKSYRPLPVRRSYIDKAGSKEKRPLGIPAYEDKIVQRALAKILQSIYERDFLDSSFGFRPKRNCHDALKVLNVYIEKRYTNYIVDVDIKGFFDNVDHKWLITFLEHRIGDPSFVRLIARFLKAGYMEQGKEYEVDKGTPQGGLISPILANVYLHYVLDWWFENVVKKECKGRAYVVRYADDFVCCFQYKRDAERFYQALQRRLGRFQLEVAKDKTKIIAFGRFAQENCARQGKKKPQTFDFLGFTHYCSQNRNGKFRVKRTTSRKKVQSKLKKCKEWLKANRTKGTEFIMERMIRSLHGYYNYYCITDNLRAVNKYYFQVSKLLYKWLNRRSQKRSYTWEKFSLLLKRFPLPRPRAKVNIYELRDHIRYIL